MTITRRNAIVLALLLLSQLLLMSGRVRRNDGSSVLRGWISSISAPVVRASGSVSGGVHGLFNRAGELLGAQRRNRDLQRELQALRTELRIAREQQFENQRLRRLLDMRQDLTSAGIGASVVTSNLSGQARMIVVDRGSDHGVRLDLPVVAWGGAIGRVVEVGARHALVRLLTDPNSGVAGVVQRSRAEGLVVGQGKAVLDMLFVPRFSDVMHGDRVVTSGLDGIFPRGFGIGRVYAVNELADGTQRIQLAPELDYRDLEEVMVLLEAVGGGLLVPEEVEPQS